MRTLFLAATAVVLVPAVALFIICNPRLCLDWGRVIGLLLLALLLLFLIFYIPYKLAVLFFCTSRWLFNTCRNSPTGTAWRQFRELKTDRRNIRWFAPYDMEDEIDVMDIERRAAFVRKMKEQWNDDGRG